MTNVAPDHNSTLNEIRADFLDQAQYLHAPTDEDPNRGWEYEILLSEWLRGIYDEYGAPIDIHHVLMPSLQSIYSQDENAIELRFAACYCLAMHLWNANKIEEHEQLMINDLGSFDDAQFCLVRHRRSIDLLGRALICGDFDQRRMFSESALVESSKCLESRALHTVPGVSNFFGNIVIFMVENGFVTSQDKIHASALTAISDAIRNLETKNSLDRFPRILMTRGVLNTYAGEYQKARSDAARARSLAFRPKHEDELSQAKIELSSLSASIVKDQMNRSKEEFADMMHLETQRSRGEMLQLLGLLGAILAFLAIGANIAIKVEDPLAIGLIFPLMGGVIVVVFGTFWTLWQSVSLNRRLDSGEPDSVGPKLWRRPQASAEMLTIAGGMFMIALSLALLWFQYG